ncbi:uncharacterized protein BJ171DRAFT_494635 [Polychytrium aggregatum]|uniref:uncharacterized protein n=1 Tax=Polychytrium aggregatum TaxID=110093 RepID=UPI0022FEB441|nr:uncharacterized protein BJ171DRAFT_494635 [Polychytrium aggregatum]KAI9207382.1 hypothetical protein BJ171DRAFT_494635 [Polychytrium aggregatum]
MASRPDQYRSNSFLSLLTTVDTDEAEAAYLSNVESGARVYMTQSEAIHSLANRILHSQMYQIVYLVMGIISVVCVVLSIVERCPSGWFYVLEAIVNLVMIVEVAIRFYALGKMYWSSLWNVLDICIVVLCVITLGYLTFGECSKSRSREAVADTLLLVIRNGMQFARLFLMWSKNRRNIINRPATVNFEAVRGESVDYMRPELTLPTNNGVLYEEERDDYF